MSTSPNLHLPYLDANQNQKTVTHNAALRMLDALVNLHAASAALSAPPAAPSDGQCWIVAPGGTGAWLGKDLNVAAWQDGAWGFYAPNPGFVAYVDALGGALMWNGTAWISLLGAISQLALGTLAIGTAADPSNPLSAKLNAALFAAQPTTATPAGTGDVRVKLSKQAAGNTASLLFQDGYSGRAEIGLVGGDDFHFKVSPDGTTFADAMVVTAAGGAVSFLLTPTAPTPTSGDASTKLATTAFVTGAVGASPGATGPRGPTGAAGPQGVPGPTGATGASGFGRTQVNDAAYAAAAADRTVAYIALTAARTVTLPAASAFPAGATLTVLDESGACSATVTLTLAARRQRRDQRRGLGRGLDPLRLPRPREQHLEQVDDRGRARARDVGRRAHRRGRAGGGGRAGRGAPGFAGPDRHADGTQRRGRHQLGATGHDLLRGGELRQLHLCVGQLRHLGVAHPDRRPDRPDPGREGQFHQARHDRPTRTAPWAPRRPATR